MPSELRAITAEDLGSILHKGMGLIVGPSYTAPSFLRALDKSLFELHSEHISDGEPYFRAVDRVLNRSEFEQVEPVRESVKEAIRSASVSSRAKQACTRLAGFPWSAVVSLGVDTSFDEAFKQEARKRSPVARPVMTLDHAGPDVPPRSTPVYHLIGAATSDAFVVDGADYRDRQSYWGEMLRDFVDRVQTDPILCIGLRESGEVFLDLIARLTATRGFGRAKFILLEEEKDVVSTALRRQLPGGSSLFLFNAHVSEALRSAREARKTGFTGHLPFDQPTGEFAWLAPFSELIAVVNQQLESILDTKNRHQLQDILFSPSTTRWDPFVHDLDLRRTGEVEVLDSVRSEPSYYSTDVCIAGLIRGSAASGKSTLLKRVSLELARAGQLVLWLKPWRFTDAGAELRKVFTAIKDHVRDSRRVVVCLDDPLSLLGLGARDVYYAATSVAVRVLILTALRSSDWDTEEDQDRFTGGAPTSFSYILPDNLDDGEWARLPAFMVGLRVVADEEVARARLVDAAAAGSRRDALATMYLLLEGARETIREAVKQEYFRLGRAGLTNVIRALNSSSPEILQRMYGLVAASERVGVPVPTEVLVSATGCTYDDWLEIVPETSQAWGILYEQLDEYGEVLGYRCRNDIVASIVAAILNGSNLGHAGEFAALQSLLSACDGSGPVYRSYCTQVLVNNPRLFSTKLTPEEVIVLFDAAIGALGEDTTLIHHKAIRLRKAKRAKESVELLDYALTLEPEPYAVRQEQTEHLHTSYAAAIIAWHEQGGIGDEEALSQAISHLDRARSETYHNARAVHVQARLAIQLGGAAASTSDRFQLLSRALADVERYILYYSAPIDSGLQPADAEMLEEVRGQILTTVLPNVEDLAGEAERIWRERKGQEGFALYARRLLAEASKGMKGKPFNELDEYCRGKLALVREAGLVPDRGLLEVALIGYFRWRVRNQGREGYDGFVAGIDWPFIHDVAMELVGSSQAAYPTFRYMLGVAKAHLNDWAGASDAFTQIRRSKVRSNILWAKRDVLRGDDSGHRQIQGIVSHGPRGIYLRVDELGTDIPANDRDSWPGRGGLTSAYVIFAFGGYRAVKEVGR